VNEKCQRCNERTATVHLTEILEDNEKRVRNLCEECAAEEQDGPVELMGMLSSAFTPVDPSKEPSGLRCDECGLGYMEFRARGRLGCPQCYEVFRTSLEPLLEKIHGGTQHVGKAPDESSAVDRSRERRLLEFRRDLQTSVREERYEEAARLRDELTRFEAEGEGEADGEIADGETAVATETESQADTDTETDTETASEGTDEDR
jgi:protein arginine kinase activator